jgi:two-component system sensor histidine kinase HydH
VRLPFRRRLFLGFVLLGTAPLLAALVALALYVRSAGSPTGPRAAIDEIAASGRGMIAGLDTLGLSDSSRALVRRHIETISRRTILARRSERLSRAAAAALGVTILLAAAIVAGLSIVLVRRWSGQVSAPIEELVSWVRGIEAGRQPPPDGARSRDDGPPELEALRGALRQMAAALDTAREREVERERLQAFRDTARRVAHEMRGPINAAQLALRRLDSVGNDARHSTALAVMREETDRLRRLADEFALFGRLPEGPESAIQVGELVESVLESAVPAEVRVRRDLQPDLQVVGRYEVLRRAVENVVRNAVEATDERGIAVSAARAANGCVRVAIADHGPGVPAADRERIFQPYMTTKSKGTGLGLTMARQAALAHGGTLSVEDGNPSGGGAVFAFILPST